MSFDTRDFRRALGKFATGVTVVTTRDAEGENYGVTASSFNTVSMDPPLILWSIDKGAYSLEAYRNAEHFVVNVLANDQVEISNTFARRGENKFASVDTDEGIGGVQKISNASAQFECRTWNVYEGGDHLIIVGEVISYHYRDAGNALVFHNGRYAVPEPHPMTLPVDEACDTSGRLGNNFLYLLRQTLTSYSVDFYPRLRSLGVNEKEWRILTLLTDRGPLAIELLARWVAQPLEDLEDTLEGLTEKGLVSSVDPTAIKLTDAGRTLALRLLSMADDYEMRLLDNLEAEQVKTMKDGLCNIIGQYPVSS